MSLQNNTVNPAVSEAMKVSGKCHCDTLSLENLSMKTQLLPPRLHIAVVTYQKINSRKSLVENNLIIGLTIPLHDTCSCINKDNHSSTSEKINMNRSQIGHPCFKRVK